jgi:hypothetical protein
MDYHPTLPTLVFVTLFLLGYVVYLVRSTVRHSIDLYDFAMLASVAVVPAVFVFFPGLMVWATRMVGVEFPFLLLFGGLFLIVFLYLHRIVGKLNQHERTITLLTQELSLLRAQVHRESEEPATSARSPLRSVGTS